MSKQFSDRLDRAIAATGLKPTHFAYKSGIPQGTISKCLHGHIPTARLLVRIGKTAGKSVDWLLTGKDAKGSREGYVAERAAPYGHRRGKRKSQASEQVLVGKLLKVLRSGNRGKIQRIKKLLAD
ncbi:MAG: helix-turn-helix domain-containing protein [Candidatus Binatia bacterium]